MGVYTSSCKSVCGYRLTPCCVIAVSERKATTLTFIHRKMSLIITSNFFEKKQKKQHMAMCRCAICHLSSHKTHFSVSLKLECYNCYFKILLRQFLHFIKQTYNDHCQTSVLNLVLTGPAHDVYIYCSTQTHKVIIVPFSSFFSVNECVYVL